MKKKYFSLLIALYLLNPAVSYATVDVYDKIVAVVNDKIITLSDIRKEQETVSSARVEEIPEGELLNKLIDKELKLSYAEDSGITVTAQEVNEAVKSIRDENRLSEEQFEEALKNEGITIEEYRDKLYEELILLKLQNKDILSKIVIDETDLKKYYEENKDEFREPEERNISQILLAFGSDGANEEETKNKAEEILNKLKEGEDFSKLAYKYSDDISGEHGGELGTFKKGELHKILDEIAFSLKEGEISPLIRTSTGFHILTVNKIKQSGVRDFEEVKGKIERVVEMKKSAKLYNEWMNNLRKNAYIEFKE